MKKLEIFIKLLILGNKFLKTKEGKYLLYKWSKKGRELQPYCDICYSKENLCYHHLIDKSSLPLFSLLLSNGVTLCVNCHKEFHTNYLNAFREPCNAIDYIKFRQTKEKPKKLRLLVLITSIFLKKGKKWNT